MAFPIPLAHNTVVDVAFAAEEMVITTKESQLEGDLNLSAFDDDIKRLRDEIVQLKRTVALCPGFPVLLGYLTPDMSSLVQTNQIAGVIMVKEPDK